MSSTILDSVANLITPDFLEKAAGAFGESGPALSKGMGAAAPLLLGSLIGRSNDSNLMSTVFDLIRSPDNDPGILDKPSSLIGKAALGLPAVALGGKLLGSLFGDKTEDVGRSLGGYAGLGAKGGSSLLNLAAPLLLGVLGKMVRSQNLNLGSLIKMLLGQKDDVYRAIPGPLRQLGLGGAAPGREVPAVVEKKSSIWRWLGPLLIALLGLWLLSKLFGGDAEREAIPAPVMEVEEIEVVETEPVKPAKPVAAVEPTKVEKPEPVEPTTEIYFTADSADLPAGTATTALGNVVAYMKAHPSSTAQIAGYHAATGDLDHNKDLARQRATAVQTAMKEAGIAKDRTTLVEPISTTGGPIDKYARRVEVRIKP